MKINIIFSKIKDLISEFREVITFLRENRSNKSLLKTLYLFYLYVIFTFKDYAFRILKIQIKNERLLNYDISFPSYPAFRFLFIEIFLKEEYYFNKNTEKVLEIIDCGANIGMATIFFHYFYPHCHILGFEPDPEAFSYLLKNKEDNNLKNVTIHNMALSDKKGVALFFSDNVNPFLKTIVKEVIDLEKSSQRQINTVPLSDFITQKIDLLKIDIEGSEDEVLIELQQKDKLKFIKKLIIEYHPTMAKKITSAPQFLSFLKSNSFDCAITNPVGYYKASLIYCNRREN